MKLQVYLYVKAKYKTLKWSFRFFKFLEVSKESMKVYSNVVARICRDFTIFSDGLGNLALELKPLI